ncbi:hypothetical protein ABIE67_010118 [Streptomyces sp. V4I8]
MGEIYNESDPYGARFPHPPDYNSTGRCCNHYECLKGRHGWNGLDVGMIGGDWDPDKELAQILDGSPGLGLSHSVRSGPELRKSPVNRRRPQSKRLHLTAILIVVIFVCTMSMICWSISYSYGQLRGVASLFMSPGIARWWPWMLYGPWIAAGFAIVRAALQGRTARWSWAVLVTASAGTVGLCVGNSTESILMMAVAGIPPITALACFQELAGQLSYRHRPRHAVRGVKRPGQ